MKIFLKSSVIKAFQLRTFSCDIAFNFNELAQVTFKY